MEQQSSTSKVTVEYFDPHDVYKLLTPGLVPRLPLRNLNWQSHSGPLRSIDTLHVELVRGGDAAGAASTPTLRQSDSTTRDDGFQTQSIGGRSGSTETVDTASAAPGPPGTQRRHQIPGLRRTPYLKVLLVRCDDNDTYKSTVRSEIREWIKAHTPPSSSSKKNNNQENHDAFEWLIIHVVIPNTAAASQPRTGGKSETTVTEKSSSSRWRSGTTPLMEKLRSDFNGSSKSAPDRVAQIRIGINDVPYDLLPRVVPAVPSGYSETEQDAETAWKDLMSKYKSLILSSFDMRVSQYEDDIKERDAQRTLPGWNFCTFFILKEGLARGFENVGLVEDALVGYDELSVGLDSVLDEQAQTDSPERHGGALLSFTEDLSNVTEKVLAEASGGNESEEAVNLQSTESARDQIDEIAISATKKAYRDMILANNVSVFDFRCYIFARQISLLLRLGNASSSREELLAKLREEQESVLHGVAPLAPPSPKKTNEAENLSMLAEICRRTLEFIPSISQVMRQDITAGIQHMAAAGDRGSSPILNEVMDNVVATFAFSVAQQILAQTSTKALPIPPSTLRSDDHEQKASIPEPKTMMHPARSSSLRVQPTQRPPASPNVFPGPGRRASVSDVENQNSQFAKTGLEELAARRADLYMLSRAILEGLGKKRGWSNGWDDAPLVGDAHLAEMEDISLDDDEPSQPKETPLQKVEPFMAGIHMHTLRTAMDNSSDFYRLYEILTDKARQHYIVADYENAVRANEADLAVLMMQLKEYRDAPRHFQATAPFFGKSGWSLLELSLLVMYCQCLDKLQEKDDYVVVAIKLLTKSCAAEKERLQQRSAAAGIAQADEFPNVGPLKGVVGQLFSLAETLPKEAKVPLANFFTDIAIAKAPEYHDRRDSCSLTITLRSLLPEEVRLDMVTLKCTTADGGPCKEITFERVEEVVVKPGRNSIQLDCKSVVPGRYKITYLGLRASRLMLDFERAANQLITLPDDIFKRPDVTLYQRADSLDVEAMASRLIALDKNSSLDLTLSTGWNSVKSCEIRVKSATGGLRLLGSEAKVVESDINFSKPPEAGLFSFAAIPEGEKVTLRFPYSVEQDVSDVLAKVEVSYTTEDNDTYFLAKALAVPVALALGVNVQDVFKHQALFSRFSVSSASPSPLRLYKSELLDSELFESEFGIPPGSAITVYPKQPATLLYKVKRKAGSKTGKRAGRTMYLKLHYSVLQTEIEELIRDSVMRVLADQELQHFSRLVSESVTREVRNGLQPQDLERAALLGAVTTSFLAGVSWERYFNGLGHTSAPQDDISKQLATILQTWQQSHPRLTLPTTPTPETSSILLPVEIPPVSVVHTADIQLQDPIRGVVGSKDGATPTARINQMLPAILHLKWTRGWDTETPHREDQEFSYEVTAPADTWLLGGRRKGHFVIPSSSSEQTSSTPETEAEVPLILIPLREGWLAFPTVEIKPVPGDEGQRTAPPACEVDWRNLGETVRVVGDRHGVTVSLDASGPGGGPLVLESEGGRGFGGRVVA